MATEALKEEPAQVKEEMEGCKAPEESGAAEELQAVERPEHTEEQKETEGLVKLMKPVRQSNRPPLPLLLPLPPPPPLLFLLPPLLLPLPNPRLKNPLLLLNTRPMCHLRSRLKTVEKSRKSDFLEGPCLVSIAVYRKCGRGSGSKVCVLSSSSKKDRDTLCIVVSLSLFFRFLRN